MINEERVAEMSHLAFYDGKTNRQTDQFETYYGRDYVGKEVLKSIFSGTLAYIAILVFFGLGLVEDIENTFKALDLAGTAVRLVLGYVVFMVAYLAITAAVYRTKFKEGRAQLKDYAKHLKQVSRMYAREEKNRG